MVYLINVNIENDVSNGKNEKKSHLRQKFSIFSPTYFLPTIFVPIPTLFFDIKEALHTQVP